MVYSYSTSDHTLEFSGDYKKLIVRDNSGVVASHPFDSAPLKLWVEGGDYNIDDSVTAAGYVQGIDPGLASLSVTDNELEGIGTIHIRDMGRTAHQVNYHLEVCPVYLRYVAGTKECVEVLSPCGNDDCTIVEDGCRTVQLD